jgi:hypothetical protein
MREKTVDPHAALIDVSWLSLREVDKIDRASLANAILTMLDPASEEPIHGFNSRI